MKTSLPLASFTLAASLLATAGVAAAQPAYAPAALTAETAAVETRHHSINVSPLGLVGGGFNANYEYLRGRHGLVVELGTTEWSSESSRTVNGQVVDEKRIDARHGTVGVGYRLHLRGKQNSLFLGAMLHQNLGTADVQRMEDGRMTTAEDDIAYRSTTLTANIGKRWMLTDHLNLTLRLGLGIAKRQVIDDDAGAVAAAQLQDTIEIPLAADGELSLGWSF